MPIWLRPAPVTAEKQGNPSEMTVLLGCKCRFAQRDIPASRKPLTTFMSAAIGWPASLGETAAPKVGALGDKRAFVGSAPAPFAAATLATPMDTVQLDGPA